MKAILTKAVFKKMEDLINTSVEYWKELGGFLIGEIKNGDYFINDIYVALEDEISSSPFSIFFSSKMMAKAISEASKQNLKLVGVFHTHLEFPPLPSNIDFINMFEVKPFIWIIGSNWKNEIRAYCLNIKENRVKEIEIVLQD